MNIFLSHRKVDHVIARSLAAHLVLLGGNVWFDEWEIQAGESIPGRINEGLDWFDCFILLWSSAAAAHESRWVRAELNAALTRTIETGNGRIIPCRLDETPLPALVRHLKWLPIDGTPKRVQAVASDVMGLGTRRAFITAIQKALDEMNLNWSTQVGMSPVAGCPECGDEESLKPWSAVDPLHGDAYAGLRCANCCWEDGGEVG